MTRVSCTVNLGRCGTRWATAALLIGLLCEGVAAQETPSAFRRVLVPAEEPASWPREGETFLPVEASEFASAIAAAAEPQGAAVLTEAEYSARLVGTSLVGGRGRWHIERQGKQPAFLELGETSLELEEVAWRGDGQSEVKLGWWPNADGQGMRFGLLAARTGDVEFSWRTARLRSTSAGTIEVPLQLPAATSTRLTLHLPAGKRPVVGGGVVLESPGDGQAAGAGKWVLAIDPAAARSLRIESADATRVQAAPSLSVEREMRYEISQRGLDVTAVLRLDFRGTDIQELSVSLPAGLKLVDATTAGEPLPWRVAPAVDSDAAATAVIELPGNYTRGPIEAELRAWGPVEIGKSQQLPRLIVRNAFWTNGSIEVALDDSLRLHSVLPVDCVQSDQMLDSATTSGAARLKFDCLSPQATLELAVAHRPPAARLRMGTALTIGNLNSEARHVAEIQVERGRLHRLTADLQPDWMIAAVETQPADALTEWYLEGEPASRTLEVHLRRAATATHPIMVTATARRRRSSRLEPMSIRELSAIGWRGMQVERNLLSLAAVEPFELELMGELPIVSSHRLTAEDRRLFEYANPETVLDAAIAGSGAVRLTSVQGTYDAEIQIEAILAGRQLQQTCHVACQPHGSGIDHVLVHLSEPTQSPPRWIELDTEESLVAERMPASDPRLGGLPAGGELWQISLRRQYARPVTLQGTYFTAWPQRRRLPIVSLPDAETQRGRITIRSTELESPSLAVRGMSPAPLALPHEPPRAAAGDSSAISAEPRAIYRYQPTRFYDGAAPAELWFGPPAAVESAPRLVARQVTVESHVASDGTGRHQVRYQIDNQGADRVVLTPADGMRIERARLAGQPVREATNGSPAGPLAIRLPPRERNLELELELLSEQRPLSEAGRLASPLPASTMTVLSGNWKLWLPQEFAAESEFDANQRDFDWRRRLFGLFARPRQVHMFNPFDRGDWNALWNRVNVAAGNSALAASGEENSAGGELPTGWQPHEFRFLADPPPAVAIVERTTITAWSLATFIAVGLVAANHRTRPALVAGLALSAASSALLLPTATAPVATAAVLGVAWGVAWRWVLQPGKLSRAGNLVLLAAACAATNGISATCAADPPTTIHRVLVPVDKRGEQHGSKYFVSSDFLRQLLAAAQPKLPGGACVIRDMRCRGEFSKPADQPGVEIGSWSVSFDVEVFARGGAIQLPLVEREAEWARIASLDGIPATLTWNERGDRVAVPIQEPGRYRLTVAFVPHVEEAEGRRQIAVTLPPIPNAEVRLTSPLPLADFTCTGANLVRRVEATRVVWEGKLESSGRLAASWSDSPAGSLTSGSRRVRELQWLRVQPSGVTLSALYLLQNGADWPATIDVTFDSRWQLQAGPLASASDVQPLPDGRQLVRLRPPPTRSEPHTLSLDFRLRRPTPFGRLRAPEIQLESIPASERTLAVSCDPALICESSSAGQPGALALAQFASAWREVPGAAAPQFVWDAARLDAGWFLAVRPNPTPSMLRERLVVIAQQDRLRLTHRSDVEPQSVDQFRWSLSVPAELAIDDITVASRTRKVPLQWVRSTPNRIQVFFDERISEAYQLEVTGSLPVKRFGRLLLPRITAADRPLGAQTVSLYRSPEVLAEWQFPTDAPRLEAAGGETAPLDANARFVRAYAIDPATADAARFVVEANEPGFEGASLTSLHHAAGKWTAGYAILLHVQRGELDEFRLRVPPGWSGPFTTTPAAQLEYSPAAAGRSFGTLAIRLPQPIGAGSVLALEIHAPLRPNESEAVSVPKIEPIAAQEWRSYLSLPSRVDGEPARWSRHDVEDAELPQDFRASQVATEVPADRSVLRVSGSRMNVALEPPLAGGMPSSVRLADTTIEIDPAGGRLATTRFVLAPQGIGDCVVELPAEERLVRATLSGHPALVRAVDPRHWRVQLDSPSLPQTLEIVSRSAAANSGNLRLVELHRPAIQYDGQALPVEINLWTLERFGRTVRPRVTGAVTMTAAEQARLRLDRLAGISQSATRTLLESQVVDAYNWFGSWSVQLQAAAASARSFQQRELGESTAVRVTQPADDPLMEIAARCDSWMQRMDEFFADAQLGVARTAAASTGQGPIDKAVARDCFISDGAEDRLRIEFVEPGLAAGAARSVALISIALLSVVVFWVARTPAASAWISTRPELMVFVAGIAAWAWLQPSAMGFAVAAISLGLALRRDYRERRRARQVEPA